MGEVVQLPELAELRARLRGADEEALRLWLQLFGAGVDRGQSEQVRALRRVQLVLVRGELARRSLARRHAAEASAEG